MKSFEDYVDGEWVVLNKPGHNWHLMQFQAYRSEYTYNAFRLKFGEREYIADISEIMPISEATRLSQDNFFPPGVDWNSNFDSSSSSKL